VYKYNTRQGAIRKQFNQAWQATKEKTGTGRPIDALLSPCAPSAGFPHEFPVWWGYFSMWNILDYPSTILPVKKFKIDADKDPKDVGYTPRTNTPFDKMNHEICEQPPPCVSHHPTIRTERDMLNMLTV
jgi:amidase